MQKNEGRMKINILCENHIGHHLPKSCTAEWDLSLLIQHNGLNILFDTGHTGAFVHNAQAMNLDIESLDYIVISHYHWDHLNGLFKHPFKSKIKLIIHPDILTNISKQEVLYLQNHFEIILSDSPYQISKEIIFLGEIPRLTHFEKGVYKDNPMKDDTALAIKTEKGLVVISGCSHSGICNICEYAHSLTSLPLYAVIGGFHLSEYDTQALEGTILYFKEKKPHLLYPMHCVDFYTLVRFYNEFQINKPGTGDYIEI